jgi:hypothetical protein
MSRNVYAYTTKDPTYPAFISVNQDSPGHVKVCVRSQMEDGLCGDVAEIELGCGQIAELAHALNQWIARFTSNA